MQAFLVGADQLGNIPQTLAQHGIQIERHVSGRRIAHQRTPDSVGSSDLVILFTDFLGHNVMKQYRSAAAKNNTLFIACRRSTTALNEALSRLGL